MSICESIFCQSSLSLLGLSSQEKYKLELALCRISEEELKYVHLLRFWGKIQGTKTSFLVLQGYKTQSFLKKDIGIEDDSRQEPQLENTTSIPESVFFAASMSDPTFTRLEDDNKDFDIERNESQQCMAHVITGETLNDKEMVKGGKSLNVSQVLNIKVKTIHAYCNIVPSKFLCLSAEGNLLRNPFKKTLGAVEARYRESFKLLNTNGASQGGKNHVQMLIPLPDTGEWVFRSVGSSTQIRSLRFEGYSFHYDDSNGSFEQSYIGNGVPVLDFFLKYY